MLQRLFEPLQNEILRCIYKEAFDPGYPEATPSVCIPSADRSRSGESGAVMRCRNVLTVIIALMNLDAAAANVCRSHKYPRLVLDARVIRNAEVFLDQVSQSYPVSINNSFRSRREQQGLYDKWVAGGRKGNPVARPGKSRHEIGFAFDLNKLQELTFNQWNNVLNLGKQSGFEYLLGDFPGEGTQKFDWPHFQANPAEYVDTSDDLARNQAVVESISDCAWKAELPTEEKQYLDNLAVTSPRFSAGEKAQMLTYIDVAVMNNGKRGVKRLELRGELYDSLGRILLVRILHPAELQTSYLVPGEERSLHILFGNVYDFERDGALHVRATYLEF